MRYQSLYVVTVDSGGVTLRVKDYPESILVPTRGYAVGHGSGGVVVPKGATDEFDVAVERVLKYARDNEIAYLGTWVGPLGSIYVDPVDVFSNKVFTIGVAYGRNEMAIYDLTNQREIAIKCCMSRSCLRLLLQDSEDVPEPVFGDEALFRDFGFEREEGNADGDG